MGTLKRFSYDNIVIHDPTAPDPVDYDGGGEGGGGSGGGVLWVHAVDDPNVSGGVTFDKTHIEIIEAIQNGIMPIIVYSPNNIQNNIFMLSDYGVPFLVTFKAPLVVETSNGDTTFTEQKIVSRANIGAELTKTTYTVGGGQS